MKRLLASLMILIAASGSARAQTAITRDQANRYYQACLTQSVDSRLTTASQQALCACTAAGLVQDMAAEDYAAIGQATPVGQKAYRHFLLDVYAPCLAAPVADVVGSECLGYPDLKMLNLKNNAAELCRCTGAHAGQWYGDYGHDLMTHILEQQPGTTTPFPLVMASPALKRAAYEGLSSCAGGGK